MNKIWIKNGLLLCEPGETSPVNGDLLISDGIIRHLGCVPAEETLGSQVMDADGLLLMPGFVQAHVHLAQTLFRGLAEGLRLLPWLSTRVWPLEAAHTRETLRASARLGIAELLLSGSTALLDMGSVRDMDVIFDAARDMGIRLCGGKIMMDRGEDIPPELSDSSEAALTESVALMERYHGMENQRLRYAFCPRFLLSCSSQNLRESLELAAKHKVLWHSHVAEQTAEVELVRQQTGLSSMAYLDSLGAADARLALAHMIHLDQNERRLLKSMKAAVLHCPISNTKLGSGVCPVPSYLADGVPVGLGSDGSPCNNRLNMFGEMRAAAALQNLTCGPGHLPSTSLLRMATSLGAQAIGFEDCCGKLKIGMRGDLIALDLARIETLCEGELEDGIVHNADARSLRFVMVDGRMLVENGHLLLADENTIIAEARQAMHALKEKALSFPAERNGIWKNRGKY